MNEAWNERRRGNAMRTKEPPMHLTHLCFQPLIPPLFQWTATISWTIAPSVPPPSPIPSRIDNTESASPLSANLEPTTLLSAQYLLVHEIQCAIATLGEVSRSLKRNSTNCMKPKRSRHANQEVKQTKQLNNRKWWNIKREAGSRRETEGGDDGMILRMMNDCCCLTYCLFSIDWLFCNDWFLLLIECICGDKFCVSWPMSMTSVYHTCVYVYACVACIFSREYLFIVVFRRSVPVSDTTC